jgi:hypothetical protein
MTEISNIYGNFHDWFLESIVVRGSDDPRVPDTLILGLRDDTRGSVEIIFSGMTRAGIENGGALNIVNALEIVEPGEDGFELAQSLLARSAHGKRKARLVAYLYATVGAEIAVEFDRVTVALKSETLREPFSTSKRRRVTISFYDEDTQQLQICTAPRERVQDAIDRAGIVFNVPPDAPDHSTAPVTDEHARQIGCMAILNQAKDHPELRPRLKLTPSEPMSWNSADRAKP